VQRAVTGIRVVRHGDAASFLGRAQAFLAAREAEHNLLLGIAGRLVEDPLLYGSKAPYLATAVCGQDVVGVAVWTPPYKLLLSEFVDEGAVAAVVDDVASAYSGIPGVNGPVPIARQFAELWADIKQCDARRVMAQRILATSKVVSHTGVPGAMRKAEGSDRRLLVEWFQAFVDEAHAETGGRPAQEAVDEVLSRPGDLGAYVWVDDDRPVSLAAGGSPTPNGVRIGPVYTPPERRGKGYASALTATLTRRLLDGGRRICFLYTDLANPTSNRVYERIGYRRVTDVDVYEFDPM
jgi:predicted GNAT family acetyltransferase